MKANAKEGKLNSSAVDTGLITLTEVAQFKNNYNDMVGRVSEANEKIIAMAFTDVITGLPNREKLAKIADSVLDDYQSQTVGGALIFVDLDDFKQINDVHGHGIGDGFLRICAEKLGTAVRRLQSQCAGLEDEVIKPVIARIGGDEFAILFPGLIEMDNIREFLSLLKMELSTPCDKYPFIRKRSASIGCSCYPKDGLDLEILLKHADIAMYHAKKLGKNRAEIYSDAIGFMTSSPSKNAARPSSR